MKYKIEVKLWKTNKYGEPDEVHHIGEYYTKEAAKIDVEEIGKRLIYSCGYKRFTLEIVLK